MPNPPYMAAHLDGRTLRRYVRGECAPPRVTEVVEHLRLCLKCQEAMAALPPGPLRIFGRPVTPAISDLASRGRDIQFLESMALARLREGGILRVSGDWLSESAVYHVVSSALSRLKHRGVVGMVRDEIWNSGPAPSTGITAVECLLQAPNYVDLSRWEQPEPGQIRILCGLDEDWSDVGSSVDLHISEPDPHSAMTTFYERQVRRIERAWARRKMQSALISIAVGWDVPRGSLSFASQELFVPVGDQADWYAIEGSWLVWGLLRRNLIGGKWLLPSGFTIPPGTRRRELALLRLVQP